MAGLRRLVGRQEATIAKLEARVESLGKAVVARDARIAELERLLEESRRAGKRQAAPFRRRDEREDESKRPGRKTGEAHGRHGHRLAPPDPDRTLDAPLPDCCPHCGSTDIDHVRDAEQFQTDLPALPHRRPPASRWLSAVADRVGGESRDDTPSKPRCGGGGLIPDRASAKAWAAWLHDSLGVPFAKISRLLAERLGLIQ